MTHLDPELEPVVDFSAMSFPGELDRPNPTDPIRSAEEVNWGPEDYAFNQITLAFDLTEEHIELFTPEAKRFWAAFVSAVAACNVTLPEGEVTVMGVTEVRDLYTRATREGGEGTRYLHQFAVETTQNTKALKRKAIERTKAPHATGTLLYARAINEFEGRRRAGRSFAK